MLLTLHHFNNPLWLEERGGFAQRDNITCYLRFVRKMVESAAEGSLSSLTYPLRYQSYQLLLSSPPSICVAAENGGERGGSGQRVHYHQRA